MLAERRLMEKRPMGDEEERLGQLTISSACQSQLNVD